MKTQKRGSWQIRLAGMLVLCGLTSGCLTPYQDTRARQMTQEREDVLLLREDIRRLAGRLDIMESEVERLAQDVEQQRAEWTRDNQARQQSADARLAELDSRIAEVNRLREQDKKDIVERLSSTIEQMIRSAAPSATRGSSSQAISGTGVEHVVGPGQTLSEIAAAYGVRSQVIIDANQLRNPDRLQVGQKLFIPD
jgi:LysM repeat protein